MLTKRKREKRRKTEKKVLELEKKPILHINGKRFAKKNGWIRIQIFGNAFERGFAHGILLSKELSDIRERILPFLVKTFFHRSYEIYEKNVREKITPIIQSHYPEFFEELQGIASGALAGSKSKVPLTLDFIVAWNAFLSMPGTYEHRRHKKTGKAGKAGERCSAFIAIGDATEKGDIIMAHNTHSDFVSAHTQNIIIEIIPENGQKIKMQAAPGFIASGSDWFLCENGIIGCETTIGDTNYRPEFGVPYFCRIRQAMQYANSLDDFVTIMQNENAGDYACSWLLGDTRKGQQEIMLLEVGLKVVNVERKTNGIFYGMNSAMSKELREKETKDKEHWDFKDTSGARNIRFHVLLYEIYYGKLNMSIARRILADHYDVSLTKETRGNHLTICKHSNLDGNQGNRGAYYPWGCTDGKVVCSKMAKEMRFQGRWGPSCGHSFSARRFIEKHPSFRSWSSVLPDMPSEPWVFL
jgi:hypothetical protein